MSRALRTALRQGAFAAILAACGKGATDSTPPLPLTAVSRIDLQLAGDSVLLGDTVQVSATGVNRVGDVLPLAGTVWTTTDTSVLSVSEGGLIRARNVGTIRLNAMSAGVVGFRNVRVVLRPYRVTLLAPDTVELIDAIQLASEVETTTGVRLAEVAPRFSSADTTIARVRPTGVGTATVEALAPGATDLLAVIGRDTAKRRMVVRVTPLRALSLAIAARVVGLGDSVPYAVNAVDTLGRSLPSGGTVLGVEPAGILRVRSGHLIALGVGRVIVSVTNGTLISRDTLTVQVPSEFPLDIVDGDGQNPLPQRVVLSMSRVAARWRQVIRAAPAGEFVRLELNECRNAVPVAQFITGVRVLIKLDTLPSRIAGQGGPCVIRGNGLPLLGTVSLNILNWASLSDRKLDDLIQHEVGHVLGIGTIWQRGIFAPLVDGDTTALDPIFVGPNALAAFPKLGQSRRFTGRTVPLQLNVRGHWRGDAFLGELMAPTLIAPAQPTSAVTVAALRDLGWVVESEAYDEFTLPEAVLSAAVVSARVVSARTALAGMELERDVLLPELMVIDGRRLRLDLNGRPRLR
ncbi:MAG: hypothetical protein V4813_11645 [Gemmatimonadota bacterium]